MGKPSDHILNDFFLWGKICSQQIQKKFFKKTKAAPLEAALQFWLINKIWGGVG